MRRWAAGVLGLVGALALLWLIGGEEIRPVPAEPPESAPPPQAALEDREPRMAGEVVVFLARGDLRPLACARILETAGIPFSVTRSSAAALARRIVVVPSDDRPLRLDPALLEGLEGFVRGGGVLVLQAPVDRLAPLTGIAAASPRRSRKRMTLRLSAADGGAYLDEPEEREFVLASPKTARGSGRRGSRRGPARPSPWPCSPTAERRRC
jgi:hypothetical protein